MRYLTQCRYVSKHSVVEWANLAEPKADDDNPSDIDSDEEAILRTTEKTLDLSIGALPEGILEVQRAKDANQQSPSKAVVQSVEFHSNGQLLLTAGYDKTLRLFQVWTDKNTFVLAIVNGDRLMGKPMPKYKVSLFPTCQSAALHLQMIE